MTGTRSDKRPRGLEDLSGLFLFGSERCGPCHAAVRWLEAQGVQHRRLKLDEDPELAEWVFDRVGRRTVPQFFLDGKPVVGGLGEVKRLVAEGKIARG
jgi:glutaredoxin